jgi:RNA polymerase sigma factor (sigma-70 family)
MSPAPPPGGASSTTSRHLAARAQRGDASALGRLVGHCLPQLRRWARRRFPRWARTAADTSDFVQDAVLHTLRRAGGLDLRGRRALAAYLRSAVRNRMRDEHRRVGRRGIGHQLADSLVDRRPSPLDRTIGDETHTRYRAALARLRPPDRALIVAHVELDYSHDQIACMTGRSRHAARMALQRAVRRLALHMRDGG